jgi:hypothetical protein
VKKSESGRIRTVPVRKWRYPYSFGRQKLEIIPSGRIQQVKQKNSVIKQIE